MKRENQSTEPVFNTFRFNRWFVCGVVNLVIFGYFIAGLVAPASSLKRSWLPGETTHGHHQIELDCNACHRPSSRSGPTSADVMQDACIRCHGEQLKNADDTHPAKKFRDPVNAELLETLDAQDCLTCHQEHVPERTAEMGLSMPVDYCWHCHQDIGDNRPSHVGMGHETCATSGCHNYHDNRAIYEKFLDVHFGDPDFIAAGQLPSRDTKSMLDGELARSYATSKSPAQPLTRGQADAPASLQIEEGLADDWAQTAHASSGVNCSHCHGGTSQGSEWSSEVTMDACGQCHSKQVATFLTGKHGMRLAAGLSPMTPAQARLPMHVGKAHAELDCNACHQGHRFDTAFAASEACLRCHADQHSLAYSTTSHATAWADELSGASPPNTGVSCATCHLPRLEGEQGVWVNHDQNAGLRPNETMARQVCLHCHGLEFSLSSLADPDAMAKCYGEAPQERIKSVEMSHAWFEARAAKSAARRSKSKPRPSVNP